MEILKQPQYQPLKVEEQVMIIYAAINHHLDNIGVTNIKQYEKDFIEFMTSDYPEVGRGIKETGKITEETEGLLKRGIEVFNDKFLRSIGSTMIVRPDLEEDNREE